MANMCLNLRAEVGLSSLKRVHKVGCTLLKARFLDLEASFLYHVLGVAPPMAVTTGGREQLLGRAKSSGVSLPAKWLGMPQLRGEADEGPRGES